MIQFFKGQVRNMKKSGIGKANQGERILGTFFHSGSALVMEAIGLSGMDYVIIDKEHAPIAVETANDMIRAAEARDLTPLYALKRSPDPLYLSCSI
ncbi:MAG: hypothetical protein ACLRNW_09045 [Neglectibacter sp.]